MVDVHEWGFHASSETVFSRDLAPSPLLDPQTLSDFVVIIPLLEKLSLKFWKSILIFIPFRLLYLDFVEVW